MTSVILAPDSAIDLQLHTVHSDGQWLPEHLIDHLKKEQFGLAAITDHDRVDTIMTVQQLASEKQMPLLVATEMTTAWEGGITDILCYGFDPANNELGDLAQNILRRQQDNTREVYENLRRRGYVDDDKHAGDLASILEMPCARQPHALVEMIEQQGHEVALTAIFKGSGLALQTNDTAAVVDAAHRSGAVCIIAHPGRLDGFCRFDVEQLDKLRKDVPFDGLEVYYPVHSPGQIAMFQEYTHKHHLLTSSGSDSHGPDKPPIKYRAEHSRSLLERLGVQIKLQQ